MTMTDQNKPKRTSNDVEELANVIGQLSTDQIRFVVKRQETSTDKEAAIAIRVSPSTVKGWKYDGAPIDESVRLMAFDGIVIAREILRRNLAKAAAVKAAGLDDDDARIRQGAATEILDRELGQATQRFEDVTLSDEERADRIAAIFDAARARRDRQAADE